ncbi:MAG TPA: hypothetical protein DEO65_18280 [Bacillus bacterium]|uniref:Uncharacterized protein n=1 Tax=Siminovitchia fordii TaxID=254759 RepID=A0ABQ4K9T2_9BACI|nr:hypothetical protein J1TS3_30370 [Siminovitchia fordii]HBZ11785.1 hypothetical protein [Bacillus sp. (in: firmicutes)]
MGGIQRIFQAVTVEQSMQMTMTCLSSFSGIVIMVFNLWNMFLYKFYNTLKLRVVWYKNLYTGEIKWRTI